MIDGKLFLKSKDFHGMTKILNANLQYVMWSESLKGVTHPCYIFTLPS